MPDYDEARQEAMSESMDEYIQQGRDEVLKEIKDLLNDEIENTYLAKQGIEGLTRLKKTLETLY
jgi:hypothetical protein